MNPRKRRKILIIAPLVPVAVAAVVFVTMLLWNWLAPAVFGLHAITFWQALGLLILSKLLFGGPRGGGGRWRHRMRERWEEMTPEERERFRQGMARGCGGGAPSGSETNA